MPDRILGECLTEKLDSRILLELEAVADGVAGIDQQADSQRQVGFLLKVGDARIRPAVIDYFEVVAIKILNQPAVLVGDGENHVHFIDF